MLHEFFLGTHEVHWLWTHRVPFPWFISHIRLMWRSWAKPLPPALTDWACDSGGYSWLSKSGKWIQPWQMAEFAQSIWRYTFQLGRLRWVAIQDWMCEPWILKKTGRTVKEHQQLTVANYSQFMYLVPHIPWVPVLQGAEEGDHLRHYEMYLKAGFDLRSAPVVGVGSVCRIQKTEKATRILTGIHQQTGLRLHGFGVKLEGLRENAQRLWSADSLAWSTNGRYNTPVPGHQRETCPHCRHQKGSANCPAYAMRWREKIIADLAAQQPAQGQMRLALTR